MTDLFAARSQMAMSLAFHIVFAAAGIGMPLLLVIADALHLRTGRPVYRALSERWAKGTAILFAVGAVSGTVLSFELGLLWPEFMAFAGPIIGMPFSLEGFAFFLEAIFLGVVLYGRDRVGPVAHLLAGVGVAASGALSGLFVITANSWMNTPTGFARVGAELVVDPVAAMFNPGAVVQGLHMLVAAYATIGFAAAGVAAFYLRRDPRNAFHRAALRIALPVAAVAALAMPVTGHFVGEVVAEHQPAKLAAMEGLWRTTTSASFTLGGWPDEEAEVTRYGIEVPYLLSVLAHGDPFAEVTGLEAIPREDRPPVLVTHLAFQAMIGLGSAMIAIGLAGLALWAWRRALPLDRRYLAVLVAGTPLGFLGIQAGWVVTEVGRQPWIVHGVMRTADAVTPMPGLVVPFVTFTLLYLVLSVLVALFLRRQFAHSPAWVEEGA